MSSVRPDYLSRLGKSSGPYEKLEAHHLGDGFAVLGDGHTPSGAKLERDQGPDGDAAPGDHDPQAMVSELLDQAGELAPHLGCRQGDGAGFSCGHRCLGGS